jgi:hypothetical protein
MEFDTVRVINFLHNGYLLFQRLSVELSILQRTPSKIGQVMRYLANSEQHTFLSIILIATWSSPAFFGIPTFTTAKLPL